MTAKRPRYSVVNSMRHLRT